MNLSSCALIHGGDRGGRAAGGQSNQQQKVSVMQVGLITSELLKHHVLGNRWGRGVERRRAAQRSGALNSVFRGAHQAFC